MTKGRPQELLILAHLEGVCFGAARTCCHFRETKKNCGCEAFKSGFGNGTQKYWQRQQMHMPQKEKNRWKSRFCPSLRNVTFRRYLSYLEYTVHACVPPRPPAACGVTAPESQKRRVPVQAVQPPTPSSLAAQHLHLSLHLVNRLPRASVPKLSAPQLFDLMILDHCATSISNIGHHHAITRHSACRRLSSFPISITCSWSSTSTITAIYMCTCIYVSLLTLPRSSPSDHQRIR